MEVLWWIGFCLLRIPYIIILVYLVAGFIERIGYFYFYRLRPCCHASERRGKVPEDDVPLVCVQLPMYNENAVARRVILATCAIKWPRLEVQVLDDSTDPEAIAVVDDAAAQGRDMGIKCTVVRRPVRKGFKAGALEYGRKQTNAQFLAILDADFIPTVDFLEEAIARFFSVAGDSKEDIALVQAQWGHLNYRTPLTAMQTLWVDDHHTLQMSYRSAAWGFVNFTGTAGVWRAQAIEDAGGWKAVSLVEDCELSFRVLFAGYRTVFEHTLVQPQELPATMTAYKAQQKRWTMGWAQLMRTHFRHLLLKHPCTPLKRCHLVYHMLISVQWPIWALWLSIAPWLVALGFWHDLLQAETFLFYVVPSTVFVAFMTITATLETRHTYNAPGKFKWRHVPLRLLRFIPYIAVSTAMVPHQTCSWMNGLFSSHSEFERTPKRGTMSARPSESSTLNVRKLPDHQQDAKELSTSSIKKKKKKQTSKIHWYVYAEIVFGLYQCGWALYFAFFWSPVSCNQDRRSDLDCWLISRLLPVLFTGWTGGTVLVGVLLYGDDKWSYAFCKWPILKRSLTFWRRCEAEGGEGTDTSPSPIPSKAPFAGDNAECRQRDKGNGTSPTISSSSDTPPSPISSEAPFPLRVTMWSVGSEMRSKTTTLSFPRKLRA